MRTLKLLIGVLIVCTAININGQSSKRSSLPLEYGAERLGKRTDKAMQKWRDNGFGQFIHFGLYAIPGGFWEGEFHSFAAEWMRAEKGVDTDKYDLLYKKFNPKQLDARAWAKQAKNMGAKYVVITTKHHDGFCLWPSKYTEHNISNSPYKKDIIKQVVEAYEAEGLDVILYFSILDWHHPSYRSKLETEDDKKEFEIFKEFTSNQLKELLTLYPSVKGFWFDGTWDSSWKDQAEFAYKLSEELRAMVPGLIIGSRYRADDNRMRGYDSNGDLMGDYGQGWERNLPSKIEDVTGNDWECVMTIPHNQWGYHSDWRGHVKDSYEILDMLARSASLDGNFVLNFGPKADGTIRIEETKIAEEIGAWMKVNGEAIHNSGHLNWEKQDWGYYTINRRTNKKYMIVFNMPISGKLRVKASKELNISKAFEIGNSDKLLKLERIYDHGEYWIHYDNVEKLKSPIVIELETSINKNLRKIENTKT